MIFATIKPPSKLMPQMWGVRTSIEVKTPNNINLVHRQNICILSEYYKWAALSLLAENILNAHINLSVPI